jgi:hypothetical protein
MKIRIACLIVMGACVVWGACMLFIIRGIRKAGERRRAELIREAENYAGVTAEDVGCVLEKFDRPDPVQLVGSLQHGDAPANDEIRITNFKTPIPSGEANHGDN